MLIDEKYIIQLRKGSKIAFEEVYNVYNDLYYFYFKYLIRNDELINELIVSFYHDLYNKINELKENRNFEFWSLMLIKKSVRNYFKTNERFSKLSKEDIDEILSIDYPFILIDDSLNQIENLVMVFSYLFKIQSSVIGRLLDLEKSKVLSIKKKISKKMINKYDEKWLINIKNKFVNLYKATFVIDNVMNQIEFLEKDIDSDVKIQGSLKTLIVFLAIIIMILVIYAIVGRTGACAKTEDVQNLLKIIKRSLL